MQKYSLFTLSYKYFMNVKSKLIDISAQNGNLVTIIGISLASNVEN